MQQQQQLSENTSLSDHRNRTPKAFPYFGGNVHENVGIVVLNGRRTSETPAPAPFLLSFLFHSIFPLSFSFRIFLPILIQLRLEPFFDLGLLRGLFQGRPYLGIYALPRPQDLALQVEAAALLGIVGVEELLEPLHDLLDVRLGALGRLDVEDLAGLVEGHAARAASRRGDTVGVELGLRPRVVGRCLGLLVGFGEGAAEHAAAGDDDLCYDSVRLVMCIVGQPLIPFRHAWGNSV